MTRINRCILLVCVVLLHFCGYVFADDGENVTWQLSFIADNKDAVKGDMSKILTIPDGTGFKLQMDAQDQSFFYVVYESADGSVEVLYCDSVPAKTSIFLPDGAPDSCFILEPPKGTEKIHIVVSREQQTELESALSSLQNGTASKKDGTAAIDKIMSIKQTFSSFIEKPVKPATTGGTTRAFGNKNAIPYIEFSGAAVYVKTIRIKH